jgi:hypothetical protein
LQVGQTLTAVAGIWSPLPDTPLTYQWYRSGKAIKGATAVSYTLTKSDVGKTIKVKVSGKKAGYSNKSVTSKSTKKIGKASFVIGTVTVIGSPVVGQQLTAVVGAWTPIPDKYTYQWYRSGKAISKATKSSYKLVSADRGKEISVKVTAVKAGYNNAALTSAKTAPVTAV